VTEPTRWRSDASRKAAADLLLRAARRPRPPTPGDFARLSRVVCDIPRRAALRRRLVARVSAGITGLVLSAALATSVWAWRRAEDVSRAVGLGPAACSPDAAPRDIVRSSGPPKAVSPSRTGVRKAPRQPGSRAAARFTRPERPPSPPDSTDPLARETALIAAARGDIGVAPGAALERLDDHRREFPRGQLAPEREFLAVEALRRLNRTGEARERALDLARSFPSSSYGDRATTILDVMR
jgi:hypothetical protein